MVTPRGPGQQYGFDQCQQVPSQPTLHTGVSRPRAPRALQAVPSPHGLLPDAAVRTERPVLQAAYTSLAPQTAIQVGWSDACFSSKQLLLSPPSAAEEWLVVLRLETSSTKLKNIKQRKRQESRSSNSKTN